MTDDRLRHRCRNAGHCGQKLPEPVDSARRAFCCRGCYDQFYRKRCVACERSIERTVHTDACASDASAGLISGPFRVV